MTVSDDKSRDAPALLLIHRTAASLRSWEPMVPLLTGAHRVIRIDLPGCGRPARPEGVSYAFPGQTRRVGAALERLGVEYVIVVGHSSGGMFATALAHHARLHQGGDPSRDAARCRAVTEDAAT